MKKTSILKVQFFDHVDDAGRHWIYASMTSPDGRRTSFGVECYPSTDTVRQQVESAIRRLGVYTPLF